MGRSKCNQIAVAAAFVLCLSVHRAQAADAPTRFTVNPAKLGQEFQGMGCGAIFYEGHITSLAARQKNDRQEQLYDDMFKHVNTRYLQLMIRHDHEPVNDNNDPLTPAFDEKNFKYCEHTIAIAKAALKRRPEMEMFATLYTPPAWMKTNNDVSAGGEKRATIKDGHDLELAEFAWAFLDHMQKNGVTVKYLAICNEPDWPHEQPGYCLTADRHAELLKNVGDYLTKMATKFPKTPKPKLVAGNTLSAPGSAKDYVPAALRKAGKYVDVIGTHDYDPRGDRFGDLQKLGKGKPVWMTEWCSREKDGSEGMINSATNYGAAMHYGLAGGAAGGGANVWMAYDWAYPPRDTGEALIHIDWGNDYKLTKPYWLFRQWCEPLVPGMRMVAIDAAGPGEAAEGKPGVRATGFLSADKKSLVVHVVSTLDKDTPIEFKLGGAFSTVASAACKRTSAKEDAAELPAIKKTGAGFTDTLPARSMVTYRFEK